MAAMLSGLPGEAASDVVAGGVVDDVVGGVVDEVVDVGVVTATVVAVGTRQSAKVVELQ